MNTLLRILLIALLFQSVPSISYSAGILTTPAVASVKSKKEIRKERRKRVRKIRKAMGIKWWQWVLLFGGALLGLGILGIFFPWIAGGVMLGLSVAALIAGIAGEADGYFILSALLFLAAFGILSTVLFSPGTVTVFELLAELLLGQPVEISSVAVALIGGMVFTFGLFAAAIAGAFGG